MEQNADPRVCTVSNSPSSLDTSNLGQRLSLDAALRLIANDHDLAIFDSAAEVISLCIYCSTAAVPRPGLTLS